MSRRVSFATLRRLHEGRSEACQLVGDLGGSGAEESNLRLAEVITDSSGLELGVIPLSGVIPAAAAPAPAVAASV